MGEQPPLRTAARQPSQKKRNPIDEHAPWKPAPYGIEEVGAIQALAGGTALPHQQKLALDWIINVAAGTYEAHFYPGAQGQRDTDYALGKANVGQQIVKLIKTNPAILKRR